MTIFYSETVNAGDTDNDITAVSDPQLTQQNSHHLPNKDTLLLGAYVLETSVTRVRIETPKLRELYNPYIRPLERAAAPPNRANFASFEGYELNLRGGEEIVVKASNNLGAATEQCTVVLWIGDRPSSVGNAPIYTMRTTYSITGVANGFASGNLTFDQTLPSGSYDIVGMSVFGTNMVAGRLILPGYSHRPGVIGGADAGKFMGDHFRMGNMGVFGTFTNVALPQLEIFTSAAGASTGDCYLDLIYRGRI